MKMFPSFECTLDLAKKAGTSPEVIGMMEHDAKEATLNVLVLREREFELKKQLMRLEEKWKSSRKEIFKLKQYLKHERKRAKVKP